jgi:hypothetical protein
VSHDHGHLDSLKSSILVQAVSAWILANTFQNIQAFFIQFCLKLMMHFGICINGLTWGSLIDFRVWTQHRMREYATHLVAKSILRIPIGERPYPYCQKIKQDKIG